MTLKAKRRESDPTQREVAALKAASLLSSSLPFQTSQHIACYVACKDEFETRAMIEMIWRAKKYCYLPVLSAIQKNTLEFYRYEENDPLEANQYGILEPVTMSRAPLPVEELDMVLLPALGFDLQGHRLGTGGGYYDRTFAFLLTETKPKTPVMVGVGFQFQVVEDLPFDAWDVPINSVLTEKNWIDC